MIELAMEPDEGDDDTESTEQATFASVDEPLEPDDPAPREPGSRRSSLEGLLRSSLRKAVEKGIEAGIGTLKSADSVVSKVVDEVRIPRDVSNQIFSHIDETKNVVIRAIAGEVREFLETTDLSKELQRALTSLSFEIRTEIRFIPNEAGGLRPDVKAGRVTTKRAEKPRAAATRGEDDEDDEDGGGS